eukprot:5698125-Amphidinium_carterae.2
MSWMSSSFAFLGEGSSRSMTIEADMLLKDRFHVVLSVGSSFTLTPESVTVDSVDAAAAGSAGADNGTGSSKSIGWDGTPSTMASAPFALEAHL